MNIGTRSILFGAHQFLLHPFFLFIAWWKLYGFPRDPRLWVCFIVHDLGYWGLPNMDGKEGEEHPYFGAKVMHFLFGGDWYVFTRNHSRFLSKRHGCKPSRLCAADKLATVIMPWWIYLPLVNLSGEIHEYMNAEHHSREGGKYAHEIRLLGSQREWFESMKTYMRGWIEAHKDGAEDKWTPARKEPTHYRWICCRACGEDNEVHRKDITDNGWSCGKCQHLHDPDPSLYDYIDEP